MKTSITHKIRVDVSTSYVDDQSKPDESRYVFSYTITIHNEGTVPAKLLTRHWLITDANGKVQEVRGEGVVGEQPHLQPGQGFRYSSGAVIETPVGAMQGSYQMVTDDGEQFDAPVAAFDHSGREAPDESKRSEVIERHHSLDVVPPIQ
jgi:ApaG protein